MVPPSVTLAANPQAIQVLEPAGARAAERRDEAATCGTRVWVVDARGGLVAGVAARGEYLIGDWVDNGVGAVEIVRCEDDGARARGRVVVVEDGADTHCVSWWFLFPETAEPSSGSWACERANIAEVRR